MKAVASSLEQMDTFSRFLVYSLGVHLLVFAFLLFRAVLAPSEPIEIRNAIRVDVVDLPDKVSEMTPPPAPAPAPTVEVPKPEPVKPEPSVKKLEPKQKAKAEDLQKKALNKLQALDAVEKMRQETAEKNKPKPVTYKGNIVNAGDNLTGLEKVQFDRYFTSIRDHVHQNWSVPQWLEQSDFKAQALVMLDESGAVVKREITKPSGSDIFDGYVLNAIDKSSPFPAPPDRLKAVLNMRGFLLNFPD